MEKKYLVHLIDLTEKSLGTESIIYKDKGSKIIEEIETFQRKEAASQKAVLLVWNCNDIDVQAAFKIEDKTWELIGKDILTFSFIENAKGFSWYAISASKYKYAQPSAEISIGEPKMRMEVSSFLPLIDSNSTKTVDYITDETNRMYGELVKNEEEEYLMRFSKRKDLSVHSRKKFKELMKGPEKPISTLDATSLQIIMSANFTDHVQMLNSILGEENYELGVISENEAIK